MHNQYDIIKIVGEGAYGIVYQCKHKETGEYVAIKKFKEIHDEIVKKTMARELKVLKILKNENIVEYKGAFKKKGELFLIFEYVEKNLLELLQQYPKGLDPNLIKHIIYQLCKSINYLHEQSIIHRDIKPENLLIDSNNKLKLCDFGFARYFKGSKDVLTDYVATRWYRSPELLLTSGQYGPEVDNWSIGCIMGELTDGNPLFPGDDEVHQLIVIQKVLGRFSDEQFEQFAKNPNFNGCKLPEVTKPETLERRYAGKLCKKAIDFMKKLLHTDPEHRLKGDDIFKHPYFENFVDPLSTTNFQSSRAADNDLKVKKDSNANILKDRQLDKIERQGTLGSLTGNTPNANFNNIQASQLATTLSSTTLNNTNNSTTKNITQIVHPNIINKSITLGKDLNNNNKHLGSHNHSLEKSIEKDYDYNSDKKVYQPNINIINYKSNLTLMPESNLEKFDKMEKLEKEKNKKFNTKVNNYSYLEMGTQHHSLSKGKIPSNKNSKNFASQENLVMTSYGFNKNLKDNILATYGVTGNFDNNFKTFYKPDKDKYNYDIDLNFKREERKNNSLQKKDHSNNKSKSKPQNKYLPTNFKSNYIIPEEGYEHNGNSKDFQYVNNITSKISPPKYGNIGYLNNNVKTKNNFYQNNVQLPQIGTKVVAKKGYK